MWALHHSNLPDLATPSDADITPVPFFSDIYTSGSLPVKSMLYTQSQDSFPFYFKTVEAQIDKKSLKEYNNVFILVYSRYTLGQKCGWGPSPKVENCRGIIEFCGKFFHLWLCSVFFYSLCIVFGFVSKQKLHLPGLAMSTVALVDHLVWVAETFHVFYSRWLQTTCW